MIGSEPSDPSWRVFFAAVPTGQVSGHVAGAAAALTPAAGDRLVPRSNYHLTLAFIGEVSAAQVGVIRSIGAAQFAAPFTICFDAYEYWPKPEVIVAVARTVPSALAELWRQLHSALAAHGWALLPKRLRPHLTLSRNVEQPPMMPALAAFEWQVGAFSLLRSVTSDGESAYTVVDTWPLLDKREDT